MAPTLLIILAAILIGTRLPSFFIRQNIPKREQIVLVVAIYGLLAITFFVIGGFNAISNFIRTL